MAKIKVIKEKDREDFEKKAFKDYYDFLSTVVHSETIADLLCNDLYFYEFKSFNYSEAIAKWVHLNDDGKYMVVWLDFSDLDNFVFWISKDYFNKPLNKEEYEEYKEFGYFS
ncbi:hypothetical protein [Neokomagataea anthophila]|uniref:Uncharacterized protein n=1 Tax=Neokomagataea anthophila TaxID=2826925 RepID=A0ABS5E758_9PROT|nr:hypothetical protein [Neokomagataea anthophila]MBR0559739.1 hypothetical protein [Neokomagataea anthophila]